MPINSWTSVDSLTPIYLYLHELREKRRGHEEADAVTLADAVTKWHHLAEDERRGWESKGQVAQQQYLQDCIARDKAAGPASQAGEESAAGGVEEQEGEGRDSEAKWGGGAEQGMSGNADAQKSQIPLCRVLRILRHNQVGKVTRDGSFLFAKAAELFLERRICEAAHLTARGRRKTVSFQDLLLSLTASEHAHALQLFMDELQPLRGGAAKAPAAAASGAGKKAAPRATGKKRQQPGESAKDDQVPAAKGRRRKQG